jgi:hypothetical protein
MPKAKLIIIACVAALVFSALASASASAAVAGWMVNKATLADGEVKNLAPNPTVLGGGFVLTGAGISVTCTSLKLKGGTITGLTLALIESLEFGECSATAPCEVEKNIDTVPILTHEITLEGNTAVKAVFKPETKTVFATIKFNNPLCALEGVQAVTGKATVLAPKLQEERVKQEIKAVVTAASGELKLGSNAASLTGSAEFEVNGGQTWSFL